MAGDEPAGWAAIGELYHRYLTGLLLAVVTRHGTARAEEVVFQTFRRQHLEQFLPGLRKLELDHLPPAVACAQYHVLSNALGGVGVVWIPESDTKSWVRYTPPRWIFDGTAVCGIPTEVSRAMLRGWHGHNGVSLGNPRLGFVCTGTITSGVPGLEGYYCEYEREIAPDERVRFVDSERMPRVDLAEQPRLDTAAWPEERLRRTYRSYAMEYVRSLVPTLIDLLGADEAETEIGRTARLIGMQLYDETATALRAAPGTGGVPGFARYLAALLAAQGEDVACEVDGAGAVVRQRGWRLMKDVPFAGTDDVFTALRAWNELWVGAALAHDRFMTVATSGSPSGTITWTIR